MAIPKFTPVPDLDALDAPSVSGMCEWVADGEHVDRIVRGAIGGAQVSVDIATADFKAMLVPGVTGVSGVNGKTSGRRGRGRRGDDAPSIVAVMRALAERGVEVRVLHSGVPSGPALEQLRGARPGRFTLRRCPRVHAKIVIVDSALLYLGSANLTGAGLGAKADHRRNFEAGVVSRDGGMIDAAAEYFTRIWEGGHCEGCGRREVCPVPLEEPDL